MLKSGEVKSELNNCKVMKNSILIIWVLVIGAMSSFAQSEDEKHTHSNDLSVAIGLVPLPAEETTTIGFHFHYLKGIAMENRLSIGIGLESIADEHGHYTASVPLQYRIIGGLTGSYAPGLMMRKEDSEILYQFSQHFELGYEVDMGKFHIGPVFEIGLEPTGAHYMGGIHLGIDI